MSSPKKVIKHTRPDWDETFMMLAKILAKRAACRYHEIASVFVDEDHRIVATGYNGPSRGDSHCLEVGCAKVDGDPVTKELKRCRGAHSEINAIMNAGNPTRLKNSTLYVTSSPCYDCMKALNNLGVKRIVYFEEYERVKAGNTGTEKENEVKELANKRGIILEKFSGNLENFKNTFEGKEEIIFTGACGSCVAETKDTYPEYQYLNLLQDILDNGSDKQLFFTPEVLQQYKDKGEEPPFIRSVFGRSMRFELSKGFPLLTTKKVFSRGIFVELLWFLSGDSNIKYLVDRDVHIWDEWAYKRYHKHCSQNNLAEQDISQEEFIAKLKSEDKDSEFVKTWGDLITIYGRMWRRWPASDGREIDQLSWIIDGLKNDPYRKSYVISAWNPDFIYAMASEKNKNEVPPFCHTTFQFAVVDGKLNCGLYQRSADSFLGVPFNIASYALLLMMVAQATGLPVGDFVHFFGDVHIYSNHFDQVKEQLERTPRPFPTLKLNPEIKNIDEFKLEDIILENYDPHGVLRAPIANIGGFRETTKNYARKS